MRIVLIFNFLMLLTAVTSAQSPAVLDSVEKRLTLLAQLKQEKNLERAQLEAEDFRWLIRRERVLMPSKAIPLISGIFLDNKDGQSAAKFFEEAELAARRSRDLDQKALILKALIKEYEVWEMPEKALACQRQLSIAQDSLAGRKVTGEMSRMQKQLDSLKQVVQFQQVEDGDVLSIERRRAYAFGGILAFILLALLASNFVGNRRAAKRLKDKDLELSILKNSRPHFESPDSYRDTPHDTRQNGNGHYPVATQAAPIAIGGELDPNRGHVFHFEKEEPTQIALIIEPNRQIVLYLKSLLSDHYEIETAATASEGLQMASELMPDLIVCDAVLNGKTGIDVVRQIKLAERTNHIPVILLADKIGPEAQLDALRSGAETWFARPVLDSEMQVQIKNLIGIKRLKQQQFGRAMHLYFTDSRLDLENPFLNQILEYIEQRLPDQDFAADELARKMQFTNTHFVRKLKSLTGREPVQLIREMRMEKAKYLLESRAAPVQKVAELVGYPNAGSFSMAFKEYFGESTLLLQRKS